MARFHNIDGVLVQFTLEEETDSDAKEAAWAAGANDRAAVQVREERDALLTACDWMACSDVTMSTAWRDYRQSLRDLPAQAGFPSTITWPIAPDA